MDYTRQDHEKARLDNLDTLVRGCKGLLSVRAIKTPRSREHTSFHRGGLGDFIRALSNHVSMSFLLTADFIKKHSDALHAEGIGLVVHDADGRDLELTVIAKELKPE